jgi:hypothetical protein
MFRLPFCPRSVEALTPVRKGRAGHIALAMNFTKLDTGVTIACIEEQANC